MSDRALHLDLLEDLADELGVSHDALVAACDEAGAQAVECDWEDEWPTRGPRMRHGWKNEAIENHLGIPKGRAHRGCKSVGILFVQAGDRRAGSLAFFRAAP